MKSKLVPEDLRVKAGIRSPKAAVRLSRGWRIALRVGGPLIVAPLWGLVAAAVAFAAFFLARNTRIRVRAK